MHKYDAERVKQQTLMMAADQDAEFEYHRRLMRGEEFFTTINGIVPWADKGAS
jgi:hypothetical protein